MVRGGIARGFRGLAISLAVYAGSAAVASVSVGLWLLAIDASNRQDPISGAFNVAGGATILAAAVLALAALLVLLLASMWLRPSAQAALRTVVPVFRWYRTALACSLGLALITSLAIVGFVFSRGASIFGPLWLVLSGVSAVGFLGAVLLPLHALGRRSERGTLLIVATLSVSAIMAEAIIPFGMLSGNPPAVNWLTLGGYPLLNWHLVFGAVVAACAAFLAQRYWRLAAELAGHPGGNLRPSTDAA